MCAISIPFNLLIFIDLVIFILYVLVFSCSYVCMGVLDALELESQTIVICVLESEPKSPGRAGKCSFFITKPSLQPFSLIFFSFFLSQTLIKIKFCEGDVTQMQWQEKGAIQNFNSLPVFKWIMANSGLLWYYSAFLCVQSLRNEKEKKFKQKGILKSSGCHLDIETGSY